MSIKSENVKRWREKTKQRIIQSFGGYCGKCHYNRCADALELHHIDPNKKEFGIGGMRADIVSWERICIELRKCVLLCSNCHRELHDNLIVLPLDIKGFDETFFKYKDLEREKLFDNCPVCGNRKRKDMITCSRICAAKKAYKVNWDLIDVVDLIENKKLNYTQIGELVGCSGMGVKKRYTKLCSLKNK